MINARATAKSDSYNTIIQINSKLIFKIVVYRKLKIVKEDKEKVVLSIIDMYQKLTYLSPFIFTTLSKYITRLPLLPKNDNHFNCSTCTKAKIVRTIPKMHTSSKASLPYELVYSDVYSPFSKKTLIGS